MLRRTLILLACCFTTVTLSAADPLPGTTPLTWEDDIASRMIDGIDKFLLREIAQSVADRSKHWKRDFTSTESYNKSVQPNRDRLSHILGVRDQRKSFDGIEYVGTTSQPALVGRGKSYQVFHVRWPTIGDMHGEGLLLVPSKSNGIDIVAVPDADQTPEMISGLVEGVAAESQYARRLAESGCRVLVPTLVSRKMEKRNGRALLSSREFIYRSAFELGRHLIGYEVQQVLAGVDWFSKEAGEKDPQVGVIGWGEGGLTAFYSAAIDTRIDAVCVSGYFDSRQNIWSEPISRNVFSLLEQFGDAEIATLVAPRPCIIEMCKGPEVTQPSSGGAPAKLESASVYRVGPELERAERLLERNKELNQLSSVVSHGGAGPFGSAAALQKLLQALKPGSQLVKSGEAPEHLRNNYDPSARQQRLMHEMNRHNQWLLRESPFVRQEFLKKRDTSSVEKFEASNKAYRELFKHEVIGHFDKPLLPFKARSRQIAESDQWTRYEVVLDVFQDVFAYGIYTVPKGIKANEKRPVVVCQHGLEGRPQSVIGKEQFQYYKAFATDLAERGFITFAPQNIYIFKDRFRTLQRKSYPIKKTLFSTMVPQHQQIVNWLGSQPQVDSSRIAFYGLSYGGKSAMRIPALVTDYCLSICSADFNEWVRKNASTRHNFSYVWTGEYEIFEWDLGSTFNYAEMASLICPRPFMVERGHYDGVGKDEWVGYEFGKVRFLYQGQLKIGDRCEIEWFDGPHSINSKGTFQFLHKHLDWPVPSK